MLEMNLRPVLFTVLFLLAISGVVFVVASAKASRMDAFPGGPAAETAIVPPPVDRLVTEGIGCCAAEAPPVGMSQG